MKLGRFLSIFFAIFFPQQPDPNLTPFWTFTGPVFYGTFRYRSYVYDHETGLHYLRARFYATSQNRFINPDRVNLFGFCVYEDSTYCYCVNAPTIYSDDEGYFAVFGFDITIPWNTTIPNVPAVPSIPGIVDIGPISGSLPIIQMPTIHDQYNVDTGSVEPIPEDAEEADEKHTAKKPAKRIRCNTRKEAYEQAKRAGGGKKPISHKNDKNGPHFHPDVRNKYSKTPKSASSHDHYYYPKRGYSLTTVVENWIDKISKYLRKIF